jgi:hypothetical protein
MPRAWSAASGLLAKTKNSALATAPGATAVAPGATSTSAGIAWWWYLVAGVAGAVG